MTQVEFSIFPLLVFSLHFSYIKSVPSDYCLSPLNRSDCGRQPTPVFAYYKKASRCEIELWKGCPTNNMFDNEYQCVHLCIGKIPSLSRDNEGRGRFSITIDHLNIYELEEIYRILEDMERQKAVTHIPAPHEVIPDEVIPDEVVPDEVIHDKVIHDKDIHDEVIPDEVTPDEITDSPDEVLKHKSPRTPHVLTTFEYDEFTELEYLTPKYRTLDPKIAGDYQVYVAGDRERMNMERNKKLKHLHETPK